MRLIWASGEPVTVRDIAAGINDRRGEELAYTTVMTVMARLAEKGALTRTRKGRGYLYEAAAPNAAGLAVRGVLREHGDAALAHFVEEARADPKALARLQKLLAED